MTLPFPGMSLDVSTHLPALHTSVPVGSAPWGLCGHAQHIPHLSPSPPPFPVGPKAPPVPVCVCPLLQRQHFPCLPLSPAGSVLPVPVSSTGDKLTCWGSAAAAAPAWAAVLPPHRPTPAQTEAASPSTPPFLRAGCCSHCCSGVSQNLSAGAEMKGKCETTPEL